jgi:hypothetical protein
MAVVTGLAGLPCEARILGGGGWEPADAGIDEVFPPVWEPRYVEAPETPPPVRQGKLGVSVTLPVLACFARNVAGSLAEVELREPELNIQFRNFLDERVTRSNLDALSAALK